MWDFLASNYIYLIFLLLGIVGYFIYPLCLAFYRMYVCNREFERLIEENTMKWAALRKELREGRLQD